MAQLVELHAVNVMVVGSSPTEAAIFLLPSGRKASRIALNYEVAGSTPASAFNYSEVA